MRLTHLLEPQFMTPSVGHMDPTYVKALLLNVDGKLIWLARRKSNKERKKERREGEKKRKKKKRKKKADSKGHN